MDIILSKDAISKFKALGIYQVAGGVVGLALTFWVISGLSSLPTLSAIIFLAAIGLYGYSCYCGTLLLQKKISGLNHSLLNQYLQLVNFAIAGFIYQYISGVLFSIGLEFKISLGFGFNLGISSWQLIVNDDKNFFALNLNLVAFFLITYIEKLKKKINKEQIENQIASIGV
jgi:hypothetical protein